MLTLFAIPKPFRDHTAIIQRNAITSWTLLRPRPQIILFGGEEGTAEIAADLGVQHVPDVARSEYCTPLVSDLFERAQDQTTDPVLCYVNADIILMNDFMRAVERVVHRKHHFLMVGRRWDVNVVELLSFELDWAELLQFYVVEHGQRHPDTGIDYFLFSRGLWGDIPPFAIGRIAWDNWLVYRARIQGAPVVDATQVVMAVHQNHDYSHLPGGKQEAWEGPEARRNRALRASNPMFTMHDATWLLTQRWFIPAIHPQYIRQRWERLPVLHPRLRTFHASVQFLVRALKAPHRVPNAIRRRIRK
jgi:hypothetical protein